MLHVIYKLASN